MGLVLTLIRLASVTILLIADTVIAKDSKPGTIFKDCDTCPEMVVLPKGSFIMGSASGNIHEKPIQKITIDRALAAGRYEITFDEWDSCRKELGCSSQVFDRDWGRGRRPLMNVLYADAQEYISWLSRKTGQSYRLPSEAEWEFAARAGTTSEYWWGNSMKPGKANCRKCGTPWSGIQTAPVGSFKPNPWGLYDVHGNVLEYVVDCWTKSHKDLPLDGAPKKTANCQSRVIKGGAWYYRAKASRSAYRARNDTRVFSYFIGFRVIREMD